MPLIGNHYVKSVDEAFELYLNGTITKRAYKKVRNFFEAKEKYARRYFKVEPQPVEPPDEDIWDNPGVTPTVSPKTEMTRLT